MLLKNDDHCKCSLTQAVGDNEGPSAVQFFAWKTHLSPGHSSARDHVLKLYAAINEWLPPESRLHITSTIIPYTEDGTTIYGNLIV